jgi:hypothetical protein
MHQIGVGRLTQGGGLLGCKFQEDRMHRFQAHGEQPGTEQTDQSGEQPQENQRHAISFFSVIGCRHLGFNPEFKAGFTTERPASV